MARFSFNIQYNTLRLPWVQLDAAGQQFESDDLPFEQFQDAFSRYQDQALDLANAMLSYVPSSDPSLNR